MAQHADIGRGERGRAHQIVEGLRVTPGGLQQAPGMKREFERGRVEVAGSPAMDHGSIRVAFQSPCTLQHGLKLAGRVEEILEAIGLELTPVADSHLCCGSAGVYSILQSELSRRLREFIRSRECVDR